jgi:hypothetical protein
MAVYTGALELPEGEQMGVLAEAIGVHVLEKDPAAQGFATELASRIRDWTLDLHGVADETLLRGELPLPR